MCIHEEGETTSPNSACNTCQTREHYRNWVQKDEDVSDQSIQVALAIEGDVVNHPSHYTQGNIEVIDFIEDQDLGYHAGNVVKYVCRYRHKNGLEDLKKARWYIDRLIQKTEEEESHE